MTPCRDCPQRYIGETSKKIETRITEHKNVIKRYDYKSLYLQHTHTTTAIPSTGQKPNN